MDENRTHYRVNEFLGFLAFYIRKIAQSTESFREFCRRWRFVKHGPIRTVLYDNIVLVDSESSCVALVVERVAYDNLLKFENYVRGKFALAAIA